MAKHGEFTIDRGRPDFKIHSFYSLNTVFALFTLQATFGSLKS
jgi:hypothetical protein